MAITHISAAAAAGDSVVLGTHAAGDILLAFAYRDGSATLPALAADWIDLDSAAGANTNSARLAYKIAASGAEVSGTWTNATELIILVFRGQSTTTPVGRHSESGASSATLSFAAQAPLFVTDGSSWVVGFAGHRTATNVEAPPTGMTNRISVGTEAAGHDTNGAVSAWGVQTVGVDATSGWRTWVVEIIAQPDVAAGDLRVHHMPIKAFFTEGLEMGELQVAHMPVKAFFTEGLEMGELEVAQFMVKAFWVFDESEVITSEITVGGGQNIAMGVETAGEYAFSS